MKLVGGFWSKMRPEKQLVDLIPKSDQRLRPSRTKLYKTLIAVLCLLLLCLVVLFFLLFPHPIKVSYVGIKSADVSFDQERRIVNLNITSTLDITNKNFYPIYLTNITAQVMYAKTVIGKASINSRAFIRTLGEQQVDYTIPTVIADELSYMYDYCTLPTIRHHNIGVMMWVALTTVSYLGHMEQYFLETYQYVDCGSNTTTLHNPTSRLNAYV